MFFADKLTLGRPRKSADGYMAVHAKAARAGIYQYLGREVDPGGTHFQADEVVNVYRSPDEVFKAESLGSFVGKPITDDHPSTPVTADNWRDLARGTIMGAVREGDYVGFDLAFLDAALIKTVDEGKRELSNGYESEIVIGDGVSPEGGAYRATQVGIRGNHIAVVEKGRAGSTCRIGDAAICEPILSDEVRASLADERTYNAETADDKTLETQDGVRTVATKTITFDGLPLETTDAGEAAINKLLGQLKDARDATTTAEASAKTLTEQVSTKDGEIAALEQKLKDAEIKPEALEQMVADRAALVAQAKAVEPTVVTDGKTEAEIRKAIVSAKLGDTAKDMDDAGIAGAFKVLTKDVKIDPVRNALSGGVVNVGDAKAEYDAAVAKKKSNLSEAWKGPAAANAA